MDYKIKLYVYGIKNKITGIIIYVGITNDLLKRFKQHMTGENDHECAKGMLEEIKMFGGEENFEIISLEESYDERLMQHAERNWIQILRTMEDGIGYNGTNGGEYLPGFKYRDNLKFRKIKQEMRLSGKYIKYLQDGKFLKHKFTKEIRFLSKNNMFLDPKKKNELEKFKDYGWEFKSYSEILPDLTGTIYDVNTF